MVAAARVSSAMAGGVVAKAEKITQTASLPVRDSCYVPEKRSLDLRDVPIDHYDLKLRQPRSQRER